MPEPEPLPFVWDGLIPQGFPSGLHGDGGTGKSYVALGLGTSIPLGLPFLGRAVRRGPVLYVDAELDDSEFRRRAYRVARGLGELPPEGLYYLHLDAPLDSASIDRVSELVSRLHPVLVILDSLTAAAYGADPKSPVDVTALIKQIEKWSTTLIIDHIPKPMPGVNLSAVRAFGSAFKFNLVRSSISVVRADGGGLAFRQIKSNFGPLLEPIFAAVEFSTDAVRFQVIRADDGRLAGMEQHRTASERVWFALLEFGEAGAKPEQIADNVGKNVKTVRHDLKKLKDAGRVEQVGGGRWRAPDSRAS